MSIRRPARPLSYAIVLTLGLALGWGVSQGPPRNLQAGGTTDRSGESILATGPVAITVQTYNDVNVAVTQDALYYLDYRGGRLLATIPDQSQTTQGTRVLKPFAIRDLVADFQPPPGTTPHFLMTVGSLGASSRGWEPLFVFETTTNQVAVYRVESAPTTARGDNRPRFELVEIQQLP